MTPRLPLLALATAVVLSACTSEPPRTADDLPPLPVALPFDLPDAFCFNDLRLSMMRQCYFPEEGPDGMATKTFHRTKYEVCTSTERDCYCADEARKIPGGVRMSSMTVYTDYVTIEELQGPLTLDMSDACPE